MGTILWMSGELQSDISDEYLLAMRDIKSAVNAVLSSFDYGDGLKELALIPIIRETDHPTYGEVNKYWKKDRSFESRLKIPHAEFKAATAAGKRKLIVGILLRSIAEMRRRAIPGIDYAKLESDVREVATAKGWA
jgi:hypothetical protein